MKNSADQGGCYPARPKAEVDNTLRDLQNSSYPTKAEFNNCFIIHLKYFPVLTAVTSHTRPSTIFSHLKTKFWWTSIKCIHDNGRVHFVSVRSSLDQV